MSAFTVKMSSARALCMVTLGIFVFPAVAMNAPQQPAQTSQGCRGFEFTAPCMSVLLSIVVLSGLLLACCPRSRAPNALAAAYDHENPVERPHHEPCVLKVDELQQEMFSEARNEQKDFDIYMKRQEEAHLRAFDKLMAEMSSEGEPADQIHTEGGLEARGVFNNFDFDGSGSIDPAKLQYLCYEYGYYISDSDSCVAMANLDPTITGRLCFRDFLKWWQQDDRFLKLGLDNQELAKRKQVVELWQEMDDNENGVVEREGFSPFYDAACKLIPELREVQQKWDCFDAMDKGDGIIEFNDCIDYLVEMKLLKSSFM